MADELTPEVMNSWNAGGLPHMLGIVVTECSPGRVAGRLPVKPELIAGNGALWGPAIVALADALCAYGVSTKWPDGASGFTTLELKCNMLGTVNSGGGFGCRRNPARRTPHTGVGREDDARGQWQAARALPLHADDSISAASCCWWRLGTAARACVPAYVFG